MQSEFSKKDKYILIFAFIFMLIPAFQAFTVGVPVLICGLAVVFLVLLGWIEIRADVENILRLFHDSEWKADGMFSATLIETASRAGKSIMLAYEENSLRLAFDSYGIAGLLAVIAILIVLGNKWWQLRRSTLKTVQSNDDKKWFMEMD